MAEVPPGEKSVACSSQQWWEDLGASLLGRKGLEMAQLVLGRGWRWHSWGWVEAFGESCCVICVRQAGLTEKGE